MSPAADFIYIYIYILLFLDVLVGAANLVRYEAGRATFKTSEMLELSFWQPIFEEHKTLRYPRAQSEVYVRNPSSEPLEWYGQQHNVRELCWITLMLLPARLLTPPSTNRLLKKGRGGGGRKREEEEKHEDGAATLVGDAKAVRSVIRSPMPANLVRYRF